MKNIRNLVLLFLAISIIACATKSTKSPEQIINQYFDGLNQSNFQQIEEVLSDSILMTEMQFVLCKNKKELYPQFQWDSVFKPQYRILSLQKDSNQWVCTLEKACNRIRFLQDTSTVCKMTFQLKQAKICKISTYEYVRFDFEKWQARRDTLIAWVNNKHPELSGFINDLTLNGALKYTQAIELYNKERK